MATMTIRNIPDEVHRALKLRAAASGRSTEAEVRQILESTVRPSNQLRMGDLLVQIGREASLTDEEHAVFDQVRDRAPAKPPSFE